MVYKGTSLSWHIKARTSAIVSRLQVSIKSLSVWKLLIKTIRQLNICCSDLSVLGAAWQMQYELYHSMVKNLIVDLIAYTSILQE